MKKSIILFLLILSATLSCTVDPEMMEALQEIKAQNEKLLQEVEKMKSQLDALDGKYQVILASLADNKKELEALKAQIEALKTQIAQQLIKINQLSAQLEVQGADIEKLTAEIAELKASCAELKALMEELLAGRSPIPTNGLVAWYPFSGNTNDESGNNNVLQSFGITSTSDRFGNSNAAYSFSNTQTNVTHYLKAVNPAPFATANYSISAWFNTTQFYPSIGGVTYNYQAIVFHSPQWYTYGPAYNLGLKHTNNSILEGGQWTTATTGQPLFSQDGSVSINQWYHAAMTYDGTTLKMYLNGALVGSRAATLSYANQVQFLIGGAGDGPSPGGIYGGFNGKLDDIGFWNKALTADEIFKIYRGEKF